MLRILETVSRLARRAREGFECPKTFVLRWRVGLVCLAIALSLAMPTHAAAQAAKTLKAERVFRNLQSEHQVAHRRFAMALEQIAQACEERMLAEIATQIRKIAQPTNPDVLRFEPMPRSVLSPIPADLPEEELEWRKQLREQRKEYAQKLDQLAQGAVKAGHSSYAYQLVREAALHDSDHPRARRLLGFVRYKDEWVSPFEADKLKKREVKTDKFGWLPATHVERYERGERPHPTESGRWISVEKEAEFRHDFRKAWDVRTEHYLLKTNHSLERGVALAQSLEEFHRFFVQTFAAFFDDPKEISKKFMNANAAVPMRGKAFEIHFFRSQDEYIAKLIGKYTQQITITNGLYDTDDQVVYSFDSSAMNAETTLYHEATHQLLAAQLPVSPIIADQANFWIIEGIACYIESFQRQAGSVSLGDPQFNRFAESRYRLLNDRYYMPLRDFTAMGKKTFQTHPRIQMNYSQSAGLVHFFMHYDDGRYRDDLIEHLRQIYAEGQRPRGTLDPVESLAKLTGERFEDLDKQYGEYVRKLSGSLGEDFTSNAP